MSSPTVQQFLTMAKSIRLISQDKLDSVSASAEDVGSAEEIADQLVEQQVLTRYQADKLLRGEGEECVLVERYHLLEPIGSGGMATVFRAWDSAQDRIVAIKVMMPHRLDSPDAVKRFKREAQALATLALPNIVKAFDSGEDRGRNFLVMELIQGISLDKLLKEKKKIPPTIAADYIYQVAVAMQRAHARGMVHRDLKPSNLVLNPDGEVKILDLGLARFLQDVLPGEEITREFVGMGTPDYMPPEQFSDARRVDQRADVYALGCTLYQLIAGKVPFPGSSLTEKAEAHEGRNAESLTSVCPEAPAGLGFVVEQMMAKRKADRYQSMREVAEALAPYVAGSSPSLPSVEATVQYLDDKVTRRRRGWMKRVGMGVIAALLLVAVGFGLSSLFSGAPEEDRRVEGPPPEKKQPPEKGKPKETPPPKGEMPKPEKPPEDDGKPKPPPEPVVVTIPNGLTVSKDGTGQFETIKEALTEVKAGQTIRVLGAGTYPEEIDISDSDRHRGITLEAPNGAILEFGRDDKQVVRIDNVAGVTVRGFRIRVHPDRQKFAGSGSTIPNLVHVQNRCPGTKLLDLNIDTSRIAYGITLSSTPIAREEDPIVVRGCSIRTDGGGILLTGGEARPVTGVSVAGNRVTARKGITLEYSVSDVQLVGNLIHGCAWTCVELNTLQKTEGKILIANNTLNGGEIGLRLWDNPKTPFRFTEGQVEILKNVFVNSTHSGIACLKGALGTNGQVTDVSFLPEKWVFRGNRRDLAAKTIKIVPLSEHDKKLQGDEFVSTNPNDPDFMRPKPDSDLAKGETGKELFGLPGHIGAVPPKDTKAWNWNWTWDIRGNNVLTVSQKAEDGAAFLTIGAALEKVRAGMTIRVLDQAIYNEKIEIESTENHKDIILEAPKGATLLLPESRMYCVRIAGVPGVTLRGFAFREEIKRDIADGVIHMFVQLKGACEGVRLEGLRMEASRHMWGVFLLATSQQDRPLVIRDCRFLKLTDAIHSEEVSSPVRNVLIANNHIDAQSMNVLGIKLVGQHEDVRIVGNVIVNHAMSGIQLEDPGKRTNRVLIANNTISKCDVAIRVWDAPLYDVFVKDQVDIRNNLIHQCSGGLRYIKQNLFGGSFEIQDSAPIAKLWRFEHNGRCVSEPEKKKQPPIGKTDVKVSSDDFQSMSSKSEDYLRPKKTSPLATQGSGGTDPALPKYIGAIAPEGLKDWDWSKTVREKKNEEKKGD